MKEAHNSSISIYNGDCFDILSKLYNDAGVIADVVISDLPYAITSNKWDKDFDLENMWKWLDICTEQYSAKIFTASQPFTSKLVMSNLKEFKHEWIWVKNRGSNFANTVREPMKEHESVIVFSKGKWTYNKQMQQRAESGLSRAKYNVKFETSSENYREFETRNTNKISELRVPSSVQKFNVEVGLHPTQKPVALMEYLVKTYTNEGDIVLDITMGSGTTGAACKNLGRGFIGIEKDEKYFNIAKERLGL